MSFSELLSSLKDLHSAVQPPVNALGNQATTTAFFPLKSERLYVLPSEPFMVKSGAGSPTFGASAARAWLGAATRARARPKPNRVRCVIGRSPEDDSSTCRGRPRA